MDTITDEHHKNELYAHLSNHIVSTCVVMSLQVQYLPRSWRYSGDDDGATVFRECELQGQPPVNKHTTTNNNIAKLLV